MSGLIAGRVVVAHDDPALGLKRLDPLGIDCVMTSQSAITRTRKPSRPRVRDCLVEDDFRLEMGVQQDMIGVARPGAAPAGIAYVPRPANISEAKLSRKATSLFTRGRLKQRRTERLDDLVDQPRQFAPRFGVREAIAGRIGRPARAIASRDT